MFFRLLPLLALSLASSLGSADSYQSTTVIESSAPTTSGDVQTYPEKVTLTQPRLSVDINQNLQKLPGATVTQFSGPGSQSGIIAPFATGSGGTQITVDGIPVISAFGRVPDLTYFPPSFFKRMDWYSPFYPWMEGRTTPGGRLDLISREGETFVSGLYGTANTSQISALTGGDNWSAGVTGFRTDGNYNYVDPRDQSQQTRANNDSRYVGVLLKDHIKTSENAALDLVAVSQLGHRTDPGPIVNQGIATSTPGHDIFFGQFAARYNHKDLVAADTNTQVVASHSVDRSYYTNLTTYTFGAGPPTANLGVSGGENSQGDFLSIQVTGTKKRDSILMQADALEEAVEAFYPLQTDRQTYGLTVGYDAVQLSSKDFLLPRMRFETTSTFTSTPQVDEALSYIRELQPGIELFASVSALHRTPSMIALYGYLEGGVPIQGLSTLPIERLQVYSLGYNLVEKNYGFWVSGWYSHHSGMALRSASAFVNVNDAQTYGITSQFTYLFADRWSTQVSAALEKTRNNDSGTELTFKPPYVFSAALNYEFSPGTTVGIEDTYEGTRYFSSSNVSAFPNGSAEPINWTHLKGTIALGPGSLYLKISNLFDAAGFDNPGYPYPGRSYWIGYTL